MIDTRLIPNFRKLCAAVLIIALPVTAVTQDSVPARQGPYERLAIVNAMVIPGHGGPAYGPADVIVEHNRSGESFCQHFAKRHVLK